MTDKEKHDLAIGIAREVYMRLVRMPRDEGFTKEVAADAAFEVAEAFMAELERRAALVDAETPEGGA